ncbi:hypothetical protein TRFO_36922 [Tritrichomonas foetus]|uniref:Uncharacterized protein n=1 Tax=Tritrichomonas foetus TaxID=1144522 RepID=A0A1J4JHK4_9EUKA|nr:hypothetical protein TRFO_36922 [Tritrichomonas foetus]|eukprot:OHS96965.1 hypothetical protein TRFO_36922 [Tritrichomonas foetus]
METFSIDMNKKEMKTLSRTNAVNFTEISDGYSYYSDGETSDDLIVDQNASKMMNSSKNLSENEKEGDFMVPKVSFHLSITQHLQSIDSKVSERSQPSNFRLFQDEDFFLEKINKPFIPKQTFSKDETVGCVIIDIAHASQYKKVDSDYLRKEPHFIAWNILCPKDTEYISPYVQNNQNNFQNNFHNQFNNFHNNFQNNNFNQNNRIMSNFPYIPNYQNNYQSNFPNCNNFPNNYPNNYQNNYPNNFGDMNNFQILQHNSLPTVSVHDFPTAVHNFYKEK